MFVTQAKCKSCSMIDQETLVAEGKRLGSKGSVFSNADSSPVEVTYIHRANFQLHADSPLHTWAKKKVTGNIGSPSISNPGSFSQKRLPLL